MKVRCVVNSLEDIESISVKSRLGKAIHLDGPDHDIMVGRDYEVQAVEYRDGGYWFLVHSVPHNDYPFPYPAEYFEVIDPKLPAEWSAKFRQTENGIEICRLSFSEWVNDDSFYEMLVEGVR